MFELHEGLTETELNEIIATAEASNINMRATIARNEILRDMAKLRLISLELQDAERE